MFNVSFTHTIKALLNKIFYLFLYLNIYTLFSAEGFAQQLHLEIKTDTILSESTTDSLDINNIHTDFSSLKKEADTLVDKLQRMGFIESTLQTLNKKNDSTFIANYQLGPRYLYIKVYYKTADFSKKELSRVSEEIMPTYFILPFKRTEKSLNILNALKTSSGNAFAKLSLDDISIDGQNNLRANLILSNGQKRTIDDIVIKGYEKFPRSFIKYQAGIKRGDIFSQKKLIEKNEAINSLGFASTIKPPEGLFKKDSTSVYLYLKKENDNNFDGILGFATDEETQRLMFNGYLNLELNNNLNFGEQLLINYKADGDEQVNFRVKANLPYLFSSPFGLGVELKIFKRDSTFVTTDQQARVSYQINSSAQSYLGYKGYESSNLRDEVEAGLAVEDYTSNFITGGLSYIKPQRSTLFPKQGEASIDLEVGSRKLEGNTDDQLRASLLASYAFNLNDRNSIFLQNNSSLLSSESYVTNELFRFGGINSIRGFNENSIDASLFSILNTEYRYLLSQSLYVHSIIDLAYFENDVLDLDQKLYSFGLGIGLKTNAGMFNLNFANGNIEGQDFKFSNSKIHIRFSSKF